MSIGGGLIIIQALDAFAGARSVPTRHPAAKGALSMKQEGDRHQDKHHGRCDGNPLGMFGHHEAGWTL
jgi:hypothetical protein